MSGKNLPTKVSRPRKDRTSAGVRGSLALRTALTFSSVASVVVEPMSHEGQFRQPETTLGPVKSQARLPETLQHSFESPVMLLHGGAVDDDVIRDIPGAFTPFNDLLYNTLVNFWRT